MKSGQTRFVGLALGTVLPDGYGPRLFSRSRRKNPMADRVVPHFHNEPGVPSIEIGAREFKCIGALPPDDHPHVYLDMGDENAIVCPYCSTLYRHNPALAPNEARPPECALIDEAA
jgi:uncharacterized Zn-finger protein